MNAQQNQITLHLRGNQWFALFTGPCADAVRECFGTACLPTPYTAAATPEQVRREIAQQNPDCSVKLALEITRTPDNCLIAFLPGVGFGKS